MQDLHCIAGASQLAPDIYIYIYIYFFFIYVDFLGPFVDGVQVKFFVT